MVKEIAFDALALGGVALVAWGLKLIYLPLCPILLGSVMITLALMGRRNAA